MDPKPMLTSLKYLIPEVLGPKCALDKPAIFIPKLITYKLRCPAIAHNAPKMALQNQEIPWYLNLVFENMISKNLKLIFVDITGKRSINTCSNTSNEGDRIDGPKGTNVNITSGDEDKSPRRLIKVFLGGRNAYSACNGYLASVS
ncbi:hypothetical protein BpHYR1_005214 [Brachionus plicatilis]|uniref:Uncharacterized protein n=1 Tax=Brachionus plicatilis TaxID=10195 RepID=A0A3M7RNH0_BRAPC|nr:hypothetical protein BpHYR1_005214 [Brachionus plicatilis]